MLLTNIHSEPHRPPYISRYCTCVLTKVGTPEHLLSRSREQPSEGHVRTQRKLIQQVSQRLTPRKRAHYSTIGEIYPTIISILPAPRSLGGTEYTMKYLFITNGADPLYDRVVIPVREAWMAEARRLC